MADIFISHLEWTGADKGPTADPARFSRDLVVSVDGLTLPMSSAPGFRGDPSRANPEQLFVAALSACQALTYLFLAAKNGIRVAGYTDDAEGRLGIVDGRMRMARITLGGHASSSSLAQMRRAHSSWRLKPTGTASSATRSRRQSRSRRSCRSPATLSRLDECVGGTE